MAVPERVVISGAGCCTALGHDLDSVARSLREGRDAFRASGALEGLGMGVQSLIISLCRYIIVIMPLAWLFCRVLGADGIWNAFWVTEVITAGISLVVYRKSVKLE